MDNVELFIELVRRSLAFRIMALLVHGELSTREIARKLGHRYSRSAISKAISWLIRNGLIIQTGIDKFALNKDVKFVDSFIRFINALDKESWNALGAILRSGSRARILIELVRRRHLTGSQLLLLLKTTRQVINNDLETLTRHGIVTIIARGHRYTVYGLNYDNPLVKALVKFLEELGVENEHENNYVDVAKAVVKYILEHWDEYVVSKNNMDTIKLTGKVIKRIINELGLKVKHVGWLLNYIDDELKKLGYSVRIEGNGKIRTVNRKRIYITRPRGGNQWVVGNSG